MLHSKADVQQNNDAPVRRSAGREGQLLGRKPLPLSVFLNHRLKKKKKKTGTICSVVTATLRPWRLIRRRFVSRKSSVRDWRFGFCHMYLNLGVEHAVAHVHVMEFQNL